MSQQFSPPIPTDPSKGPLHPTPGAEPSPPAPVTPPNANEGYHAGQFWDWLTFIALSVLVYHLLALWYRWLRPDPEFLGFTGAVAELLAIGSFLGLQTERGRQLALRFDRAVALRRLLSAPWRMCLLAWLLAAVAALALYLGSPWAAGRFNVHGATALEQGRYSIAIRDFRRSASLSPNNARTHFNLASAYEALHDNEQAVAEYQIALELDESFYPSYNNLGRLYLAQDKPDAALEVLLAGRQRVNDPLGQTVINKNIARAYLEQTLPRAALDIVDEVLTGLLELQYQGMSVEVYLAETHRLEALSYQTLDLPNEAQRAWQDCLGYALAVTESTACVTPDSRLPTYCLDALYWVAEAREYLNQ